MRATTWDVLSEVDEILENSPGWRKVNWREFKKGYIFRNKEIK